MAKLHARGATVALIARREVGPDWTAYALRSDGGILSRSGNKTTGVSTRWHLHGKDTRDLALVCSELRGRLLARGFRVECSNLNVQTREQVREEPIPASAFEPLPAAPKLERCWVCGKLVECADECCVEDKTWSAEQHAKHGDWDMAVRHIDHALTEDSEVYVGWKDVLEEAMVKATEGPMRDKAVRLFQYVAAALNEASLAEAVDGLMSN